MAGRSRAMDESRIDAGLAGASATCRREERSLSALRVFLGHATRRALAHGSSGGARVGPRLGPRQRMRTRISLDALALGFDMTDVLDHPRCARR